MNHHLLGFQQVWNQLMCTIPYHITIQFNPPHFIIIWALLFLNYITWFYFDSQLIINQFNSQLLFFKLQNMVIFQSSINHNSHSIQTHFSYLHLTWFDWTIFFRAYNTSLSIILPFLYYFAFLFHHTPNE